MKKVIHELEPIYNNDSKILILGSVPSVKSRELGFYYMHPQNRFWKVLENIFQESIIDKKTFCLQHGIALWDTISSCEMKASSDATIKNITANDLSIILKKAHIKAIFTTGKKAHQIYQKYLFPKYKIADINLSSTSPANATKKLQDLIEEYKIILKYLVEENS